MGPAFEGREAVLWGISYEYHVKAYERCVALFEKEYGGTFRIEPEAGTDNFIAAVAAGQPPDVECLMGEACTPLYMRDLVLSVDETVFEPMGITEDDWWGDSLHVYTWQGKHYGVPLEANNVGQCVNVPVDDVEALGLADQYPPTNGEVFFESFDSLWELAEALMIEEGGEVIRWGISSKGWDSEIYGGILRTILSFEDKEIWDNTAKVFNFDTEAGVRAMQYHAETPIAMGIESELDQHHVDSCLAGKVALCKGNIGPSTSQGRDLGYNFMIAGAPKIDGEEPLLVGEGGWGYITPVECENPDMAIAFLQMMCTTEGQTEFSRIYGGSISPAWKGLVGVFDHYADPTSNNPTILNAELNQKYLTPRTKFWGNDFGPNRDLVVACGQYSSEVRMGNMTSAEAVAEIQNVCMLAYEQFLSDMKELGKM
jgi:ABC-type glycerol-3-phosphate transport system substrate-binding protein